MLYSGKWAAAAKKVRLWQLQGKTRHWRIFFVARRLGNAFFGQSSEHLHREADSSGLVDS